MNNTQLISEFINQAKQFEGEIESGGQNRSPFIDKINIWMPLAELGDPYCMTGICYCLHLLEQRFAIKFDLKKHPGAIDFYDFNKIKYKSTKFEIGNLVFWTERTSAQVHVGIILAKPDTNGNFDTLEFNVVVGPQAGVFVVNKNIHGDQDLRFHGLIDIRTSWVNT